MAFHIIQQIMKVLTKNEGRENSKNIHFTEEMVFQHALENVNGKCFPGGFFPRYY